MDSHETAKTLRETLKDALRAKGMSANKLAEITEITPRYIRALIDNDPENLPPAPYVRGYLERIAQALDTDAQTLWRQYQHDERLDRSGEKDLLPSNRFAHPRVNKKAIALTIVVLVALVYFVPQIANFFGRPGITITDPATNDQIVPTSDFFITGKVDDPKDKVLINSEEVIVNPDGTFSKEVLLQNGSNTYTIVAHRFLGRDTTVVRTIILAPTASSTSGLGTASVASSTPQPHIGTSSPSTTGL